MAVLRRTLIVIAALAGGAATSQFPEFAQQYRQRIGGALDEIRQVVADLDADASRNSLTREEALERYSTSDEAFLRDRGVTMGEVVRRYQRLTDQRANLDEAPPLLRPVAVLRNPDPRVARGAWQDFEPALPLTVSGAVWAGIGGLVGGLIIWLLTRVGRLMAWSARRQHPLRAEPRF